MLLDDDSSAELKSNREAQNISFNVGNYFSSKNTIKDILECKEFSGFANLLVPETDKKDLNVHLNEYQRIMPYYRNVTARHTIEALDYLYDEVKKGNQIFLSNLHPKAHYRKGRVERYRPFFSLEVRKKLLLP